MYSLCHCVRFFEIGRLPNGYCGCAARPPSSSPADSVFGPPISKKLTQLTQIFEKTSFFLCKSSTYLAQILCQNAKITDTNRHKAAQKLTQEKKLTAQKRSCSLGYPRPDEEK